MRIAVIMAGRIAGFQGCVESHRKHIFQSHDVDVFLAHNALNTGDDLMHFRQLYPVKDIRSFTIDTSEYAGYPLDRYHGTCTLNGITMFSCIHEAYKMIPEPTQYDAVLYMRADELIECSINFLQPEENTVYIPSGQDHAGGLNDQFAYGSPETMRLYCATITRIHDIMKTRMTKIHPETINRHSLELAGLVIRRFPFVYELNKNRYLRS